MIDAVVHEIHQALTRVVDPCSIATGVPLTLAGMGLVEDVTVIEQQACIRLRVTSPFCMQIGNIQERIHAVVAEVPGIDAVQVEFDDGTAWLPSMMHPEARRRLRAVRPLPARGNDT